MDLIDLKPKSDTVTVNLVHPFTGDALTNEDGSQMSITVDATHSKTHKEARYEITNKRLQKSQRGKNTDITAEELEENTLDILCKITSSWNITYAGSKPKLTPTEARKVYEDIYWIKDQIDGALTEAQDFTKA